MVHGVGKEVEMKLWNIIWIRGLLNQNECGLWEGEWRTFCEAVGLCSTTKVVVVVVRRFLRTKKEFKFEQEIIADLKVLNLKSDLKNEVKALT